MHPSFKQKIDEKEAFPRQVKALKPFMEKYGKPVLVHSTPSRDDFISILKSSKIKLPDENTDKKSSYMEKILGIDKGIFYSIGFIYKIVYGWKYSLVFDLNYLEECEYHKKSLGYQAYKILFNYFYENDDTLLKLANKNELCKEVVNTYLHKEFNGEKRKILQFWLIEKEIYEEIMNHPQKDHLIKLAKQVKDKLKLNLQEAIEDAPKILEQIRAPEIISFHENDLKQNRYFLGIALYEKDEEIEKLFKKNYPDREIFFIGAG